MNGSEDTLVSGLFLSTVRVIVESRSFAAAMSPEVATAFDAPATAAALGGELRHEHAQSHVEVPTARPVAGERGVRGQNAHAAGRDRDRIARGNEGPKESSHKCTHTMIQLYQRSAPPGKASSPARRQELPF